MHNNKFQWKRVVVKQPKNLLMPSKRLCSHHSSWRSLALMLARWLCAASTQLLWFVFYSFTVGAKARVSRHWFAFSIRLRTENEARMETKFSKLKYEHVQQKTDGKNTHQCQLKNRFKSVCVLSIIFIHVFRQCDRKLESCKGALNKAEKEKKNI